MDYSLLLGIHFCARHKAKLAAEAAAAGGGIGLGGEMGSAPLGLLVGNRCGGACTRGA